MPLSVLLLITFFLTSAVVAGAIAARVVGPRRLLAVPLPVLAALGGLWIVGHEGGPRLGPTVELLGFEVNLLFDLVVALLAALLAAVLQRPLLLRLGPWRGARV